ncbi:hypothetical protein [Lacticaseibacillus jixiensis]|uniref:hypothetical protein n=1 Tax=Lacticaseibacillus jixiensis TaxID=3231926 RepID=UPI0036F260B0
MDRVMGIVTNMWFRELVLVALIVLLLVRYYFRYVSAVKSNGLRSKRRRTHNVLVNTRVALVILVLALVAVVGYDRVLPKLNIGGAKTAQAAKPAAKASSHHKVAAKKSSKKKSSSSKSSSSAPLDATRAVAIVKGYYEKNPDDTTNNGVTSYQFVQKGSDSTGAQVYQVGGYGVGQDGSQQLLHMFYVHADGKFDVAY